MGADEVKACTSPPSTRDLVSAAKRNRALCAILFLYRHVLGRVDVTTTMIYTHVLNLGPAAVRNPLDPP